MARRLPAEAVVTLRRRLERLAPRDPERARLVASAAELYGITRSTLYRALQGQLRPRAAQRAVKGVPRAVPTAAHERYCEVIAALKLRTTNGKGRHLSTRRAIALLEEHGVETKDGLVRAPRGVLKRPTIDRYLRRWGLDRDRLTRPPAAIRFEAERSNALWQLDLSPSDLKQVKTPPRAWAPWRRTGSAAPPRRPRRGRSGTPGSKRRCGHRRRCRA